MPKSKGTDESQDSVFNLQADTDATSSRQLGITQEYTGNRELWDSTKAKKAYADSVFADKQTIVDENGTTLHKSHTAAKNKYHQKNAEGENISTAWANHAAEVDHRVSLEYLHEHAKHNPLLTDDDLKNIANSEANYQILSKSQNASKGADNAAGLKTHAELHGKFAAATIKNAGSELQKVVTNTSNELSAEIKTGVFETIESVPNEFKQGAMDAVQDHAVEIITESLYKLIVEKESVEDTVCNAGEKVVDLAVQEGISRVENLLQERAIQILKNCDDIVLSNIMQMNGMGQILEMGAVVGDSAVRYLYGEISEEEFINEILLNGAAIGITTVLSTAFPILAPVIEKVAVYAVNLINETNRQLNNYYLEEQAIRKLEREAVSEMEKQREAFHRLAHDDITNWDETVESAFAEIFDAATTAEFDWNGVVNGLDKILSLCGEEAKFHSVEEWESQLDLPLTLSF